MHWPYRSGKLGARAKLQQTGSRFFGFTHGVFDQSSLCVAIAKWSAVIQKWKRDQVMSEDCANTHEWKHTMPRIVVISRRDVQAFVAQHVTHDFFPPVLMTEGTLCVRFDETIPFLAALGTVDNPDCHLTGRAALSRPSVVPIG